MSIVAVQQSNRLRDFLAYSSIIVKAANDYESNAWLLYDVHFRSLAALMRLQCWGRIHQALWSQHFCKASSRKGAGDAYYQLELHSQEAVNLTTGVALKGNYSSTGKECASPYQKVPLICIKWNREECRSATCTYRHIYLGCHGQHRGVVMPQCHMHIQAHLPGVSWPAPGSRHAKARQQHQGLRSPFERRVVDGTELAIIQKSQCTHSIKYLMPPHAHSHKFLYWVMQRKKR